MAFDSRVLKLRFEQSHVHIGGAFVRACPAGKTIAQRGFKLGRFQRVTIFQPAQFQRSANSVGASARGHDFVARGNEGRAHRRRLLEARAAAVALLQISDKRLVLGRERQHGFKRSREFKTRAQIAIDLVNEKGGVGGKYKVAPVSADSQSKPDIAINEAVRLIDQDERRTIVLQLVPARSRERLSRSRSRARARFLERHAPGAPRACCSALPAAQR